MAKEKIKKDPFYMDTNTERGAELFDDYIYQQLAKLEKDHPEIKYNNEGDKKNEKYPSIDIVDWDVIDEIIDDYNEEGFGEE